MASFSFDIVSDYDKAEMNNVLAMVQKEIASRYDFKDTPADVSWLGDKVGFSIIAQNDWQIDSIIDIIRKKLASRDQTSKVLDLTQKTVTTNLKATKDIPFICGLDQTKAKLITKLIKEQLPKVKSQIQAETVRVSSNSKDDLQKVITVLRQQDFDFPLNFINYR